MNLEQVICVVACDMIEMAKEKQSKIRLRTSSTNNRELLEELQSKLQTEFNQDVSAEYQEVTEKRQKETNLDYRFEEIFLDHTNIIVGYLTIKYLDGAVSQMGADHGQKVRDYIRDFIDEHNMSQLYISDDEGEFQSTLSWFSSEYELDDESEANDRS